GKIRKITEAGTEFRSHIDGALCFLSPEISMELQAALGAEIAMAFDEGAPGEDAPEEARASMELTLRWAKRSREAFDRYRTPTRRGSQRGSSPTVREGAEADGTSALPAAQALFGIVQGASYLDLRRE